MQPDTLVGNPSTSMCLPLVWLLLFFIAYPVNGQVHTSNPVLEIQSAEAFKGQQVDIHIHANDFFDWNITALELSLLYDNTVLKATGVTMAGTDETKAKTTLFFNKPMPGELRIAGAGAQALAGGDEFLTVHFNVLDREGVSTVALNDVHLFGATGPIETRPGHVTVHSDLVQNFPNPFSTSTTIRYALKSPTHVSLKIYDTLGQLVRTVVNEYQMAGSRAVEIDSKGLASGTYTYHLKTDYFEDARQMVIVR